ncbi:MAG TPA: type VI secretion system baseplate subunit TssE [Pyrinomonadaceae bacterium]|nr:type VI secretion system baseplate subunit TssE [Pyrinomonadaceae bacterium]
MRSSESNVRVTPSVLDRLIDLEPRELKEGSKTRSTEMSELRAAVRRDLEWLLNTRCFLEAPENGLEEAKKSVAFYGLPDITGLSAKNSAEQNRLAKALENAIRIFEPRFLDLKVTLEHLGTADRSLKFRIEAKLDVDPAPEPIAFDTVLELGSGDFSIREQ